MKINDNHYFLHQGRLSFHRDVYSTTGVELDYKLEDLEVSKLVEHILSDGHTGDDLPF